MITDDRMLTIHEAAERIGVHYQTIRNWMKAGQIDYRKWGHTVRIPLEALEHGKSEARQARQPRGDDLPA